MRLVQKVFSTFVNKYFREDDLPIEKSPSFWSETPKLAVNNDEPEF